MFVLTVSLLHLTWKTSIPSSSPPLILNKGVLILQDKDTAPSLRAPRVYLSWHRHLHGPGPTVTHWPTAHTHKTFPGEVYCRTIAMLQYKEHASNAAALSYGSVRVTSPLLGRLTGLAWDVGIQPAQAWLKLTASSAV